MLPCVERRSPAMRTPPGYFSATIVVPCGELELGVMRVCATDARRQQFRRLAAQIVSE